MPGEFNIPVPDVRLDPNEGKLPEPTNNNILGLATQAQQLKQLRNQNALFPLQQQGMQLENTGRALKNTQDQFTIQAGQRDRFNQIIAQATAGLPADQAAAAGMAAVARAVDAHILDQDTVSAMLGQGTDWASLSRQAVLASGNENQIGATFGTASNVGTVGGTQGVLTNRFTGTQTRMSGDAAYIPNTVDPTKPVGVVGAGGNTTQHLQGEFYNPDGTLRQDAAPPVTSRPNAVAAATAVGGAVTEPVNYQAADGSARSIPRGAIQNPDGSFKPNVQDADGNQVTDANGALKVTLGANAIADLSANAKNQADREVALQTAFEGSQARKALIESMRGIQGDFRSGAGAGKWAAIVTEFNRIFGTHLASDQNSAQQVFGKMSEMLAAQQRDTLGLPATNAGAEAAHIASPNTVYDPAANLEVLAQFDGNEDLIQRKQEAWNAYHAKGGTYNGFIAQFNRAFDPRAFWEPYMSPHARETMLRGMTPEQRAAYEANKAKVAALRFR